MPTLKALDLHLFFFLSIIGVEVDAALLTMKGHWQGDCAPSNAIEMRKAEK